MNKAESTYEFSCPLELINLPGEEELKTHEIEMEVDEEKQKVRFRVAATRHRVAANFLTDLVNAKEQSCRANVS